MEQQIPFGNDKTKEQKQSVLEKGKAPVCGRGFLISLLDLRIAD